MPEHDKLTIINSGNYGEKLYKIGYGQERLGLPSTVFMPITQLRLATCLPIM